MYSAISSTPSSLLFHPFETIACRVYNFIARTTHISAASKLIYIHTWYLSLCWHQHHLQLKNLAPKKPHQRRISYTKNIKNTLILDILTPGWKIWHVWQISGKYIYIWPIWILSTLCVTFKSKRFIHSYVDGNHWVPIWESVHIYKEKALPREGPCERF